MLPIKEYIKTKTALPVFAAAGLFITVIIIQLQPTLTHDALERPSAVVNFISVEEQILRPEIIGYGTVKPDLDLLAKAEVTGRVTYIHPLLKKGEIFEKNTLLIQIDDKDYQLQLKQAEADLIATEANLAEMKINIENNKLELSLAKEKLKVREKEYARLTKLRKSGSVSQSSLEKEHQNLLQQKQEMQQLTNKQTTLPSQLEVVKAKIEISKANLQKSIRDLERTNITIPFEGRISQVNTELNQFVATGTQLFEAFGIHKIIVNAQFPIEQFRLFSKSFGSKLQQKNQAETPNMSNLLKSLDLTANIEVAGGNFETWSANVERFSNDLDPQSRTVGVIVSVIGSYNQISPGHRPPLLEGMYMKVKLRGVPIKAVAFPRFALHENQVYTITTDNKLKRVDLKEIQYQGNLVLANATLKAADRVITSDIFPAVDGMDLSPISDTATIQEMQKWLMINNGVRK